MARRPVVGTGNKRDMSWYSFSNEAVPRLVPVNGEFREAIPDIHAACSRRRFLVKGLSDMYIG